MRRINALFMLLAMMAGVFFAYGQTSPQDTYYKFNQTYAAGATVAPDEGNGGNLTVKQAVISLPDNSYPKHYLDQKYYFGMPIAQQSTQAQRITIDASPENPAHIFIVGNCTTTSPSILKLAFNTYDNVIDQWQPLSHNITTRESSCVVELTTTHSGEHLLYMSNTDGKFYLSEIRVLYEQNEMWTNIRNSLSLELNQTTTTTANPEVAYFFRLQGCFWSTESEGYYISHDNSNSRLARNISFKPYADGTIAMKAIKRTDGNHDYFYISVLTRPSTCEKSESSYRRYEAPTTVTDFSFPVQKGVEYVIDGTIAVPEIRFIPDHYTVTLNPNGGTVDPTELVYIKDGDPITAFPTPTNGNYIFDRWDPAAPTLPYAPTADITYTAQWTNPHGQCGDDLYWEYDPSTTTLTITGTGDMYDYTNSTHAPWYDYRTAITTVVLPDGLTKIGNFAFYQCNNASLTSINIPASVTSIGQNAFNNCTNLASIDIPASVTSIGLGAFFKCSSLTSINIPSGVTSIDRLTFAQCGLTTINIPANVTTIGEDAFQSCHSLAAITLAEGLESIGAGAFMYCYPLTSIDIPASVTSIGMGAFSDCSSLADVTVHWETNIPTFGNYAFYNVPVANVKLHVPCEKKSDYAAETGWKDFTIVDPCAGNYPVTANGDPDNAGIYYSTFYYSTAKYLVPENVEAYAASVNGSDLVLTKIAEANEVLPAGTAVILKSTVDSYTMVPSDDAAVTVTATNHLHGVDADTEISSVITSGTCYVLSYKSGYGVGFYLYQSPNQLKAHKAYINLDGSGAAQAPRHLRFVFNSTTGIEDVQGEKVQGEKFLRDGVLYIQRGEHLYNAQGMKVQ